MQLCLRPPVEHARGKPCFGKRYGGLAALLALLHRMGVPLTGWLPPCPFHRLTGLNWPGCGTTRMLEALYPETWPRRFP